MIKPFIYITYSVKRIFTKHFMKGLVCRRGAEEVGLWEAGG